MVDKSLDASIKKNQKINTFGPRKTTKISFQLIRRPCHGLPYKLNHVPKHGCKCFPNCKCECTASHNLSQFATAICYRYFQLRITYAIGNSSRDKGMKTYRRVGDSYHAKRSAEFPDSVSTWKCDCRCRCNYKFIFTTVAERQFPGSLSDAVLLSTFPVFEERVLLA